MQGFHVSADMPPRRRRVRRTSIALASLSLVLPGSALATSTSNAAAAPVATTWPTSATASPAGMLDRTSGDLRRKRTCRQIDYSRPRQGAISFVDNFPGNRLNRSKWYAHDQLSLSYDAARVLRSNVSVADGLLRIRGQRRNVAGRHFTSGYLNTIGKFSQRFGHWEMRAKVPTTPGESRGVWPAFWLRNDKGRGEVDIMEAFGGPTDQPSHRADSYSWTLHEDSYKTRSEEKVEGWGTREGAAPVSRRFHTYGFNWSPRCMSFFFDDKLVGNVHRSEIDWYRSAFLSPMNIRLNLQIGHSWAGFPDPERPRLTKLPARFLVDYVKVYKPWWRK